ncbi:amidohydrolase family protein [Sphingobium sp. V4]|uniref:N-acyl-D-amino-acid deacylase family protein n=1 Tax=Sphingobium sp. V4 TaxID=3038927 RepID=UPI0025582EAA|nr:amidohydrolase family protein [Sphingobium sp. V4]WIW89481.1 amidohydrolase family protein [Sphingobium sp. V4]
MLDIVIRGGTVFDGCGTSGRRADVGILNGKIAAIGDVPGPARQTIDAGDCIVTPGFVDPHTHYDGQAIWSSRMKPSSSHGVTTVVAGNCGVGFAPCRHADHDALVSAMEGVEDIPGAVMAAGLDWNWESFPEFLDCVERQPRDIDVAFFLPHSPLRLYVMGERALALEPANSEDLERMADIACEAVRAGALGFATSRLNSHRDSHGNYIPSYNSASDELLAIMCGARRGGNALFQMVPDVRPPVSAGEDTEVDLLTRISKNADCTATFTLVQNSLAPNHWKQVLGLVEQANRLPGVSIRPQVFPRPVGMLFSLSASLHPFALCPSFQAIAHLPLAERVDRMREPATRERLVSELPTQPTSPIARFTRMWDRIYRFDGRNYSPDAADSLAAIASQTGKTPQQVAYDLLLENDGRALMLATIANFEDQNLNAALEMMRHPAAIVGLGDGGAHYGMICDASYPTYLLSYWTRDRDGQKIALADAVRLLTSEPAALAGLHDRGRIAPGYRADINVIDYDALSLDPPTIVDDLPAGGHRFLQGAKGYRTTMVGGIIIEQDGKPTGALPGKLIRGSQRAPEAAILET